MRCMQLFQHLFEVCGFTMARRSTLGFHTQTPKTIFGARRGRSVQQPMVRDTLTKLNEERMSMTQVVAGQVVQQTEEVKISSEALLLLQEASEAGLVKLLSVCQLTVVFCCMSFAGLLQRADGYVPDGGYPPQAPVHQQQGCCSSEGNGSLRCPP